MKTFLADARPDKRRRLVDSLLSRTEFVDYWTYKWSDLLLVSGKKLRPAAMWADEYKIVADRIQLVLSAAGHITPTLITLGIAAVLTTWSLYALSGAGVIPRLPLIRSGLSVIAGVYLLRGLAGFVLAALAPGERSVGFWVWSSLICLVIGALYFVGTRQAWSQLSRGAV